ncbi:MAG: hypothetical protein HQL20_07120 [Candidatus Omnitrophica bacterium]|nr:hypothetical protein [Candidatus Omnitrophota bacterium]
MTLPAAPVNADVLDRLLKLYTAGRLAHAYIFTGRIGTGKAATALALAQAINCLALGGYKPGCGCLSCHKIQDGNHPDIYQISRQEDKSELVISQVRGLIEHLALRALEARVRTAIIQDADLLNTEASNAFLKTLEEPRPGTLLILTSAAPGNILKTVLSRCHEVRFNAPGNSALVGQVKSEYDDPAQNNAWIDEFIFGPASEASFKKWSEDKDQARQLLQVVLTFYRDVLCVQSQADDRALYHVGRAADIRRMAARLSAQEVQLVIVRTVKAVEAVNENFNVKLALMLLKETIR